MLSHTVCVASAEDQTLVKEGVKLLLRAPVMAAGRLVIAEA